MNDSIENEKAKIFEKLEFLRSEARKERKNIQLAAEEFATKVFPDENTRFYAWMDVVARWEEFADLESQERKRRRLSPHAGQGGREAGRGSRDHRRKLSHVGPFVPDGRQDFRELVAPDAELGSFSAYTGR